jgi:uncharacterized protein (DUF1800 family)
VLGVRYAEAGIDEGERVIRALCRHHPRRGSSQRLVAHLVAVARRGLSIASRGLPRNAWRPSRGCFLIDLPEAWDERMRKFRTPQDWLVAVLRAFNATDVSEAVLPLLRQLRHPLWSPQAPKGFGDKAQEWADPDSLLNRAELSRSIARRLRAWVDQLLLELVEVGADDPLRRFVADTGIAADERMALVLAGPAFQWR